MEFPLISVIIPVYNVEKYLKRCVDSVIQQTYPRLDIVLVDDGSKDKSGYICEEYKEKDSRIRVVHKENGGLSDARNAGIDIAEGRYITFIDSDDYVATDYVEFLYGFLNKYNADISGCFHRKFTDGQQIITFESKREEFFFDGEGATIDLCYQKHISNSACGKLYKKELFRDIRYPVGRLYEDLGTTYKLFLLCNIVVFSMVEKYYYYQRHDSIMHYNFTKKNMDRIVLSDELYQNVSGISLELKKAAIARVFVSSIQVLREIPLADEQYAEEKKIIGNYIRKYRKEVILNKNVKKINRIIAFSTCFGLKSVQQLGKIYKLFYRN